MSECYLCGAYIPRGEGRRRQVHTSSSARVYVGRLRGGSFGMTFGRRTLCANCAAQVDHDTRSSGEMLAVIAGWLVSAVIGFVMIKHSDGTGGALLGFGFVGGLPVWLVWGAWLACAPRALPAMQSSLDTPATASTLARSQDPMADELSRRVGEPVGDWLARLRAAELLSIDDSARFTRIALHVPPEAGESIEVWTGRAAERLRRWSELDPHAAASARGPDETLTAWVDRVGPAVVESDEGAPTIIEVLLKVAQQVPPHPGETAHAWSQRVAHLVNQ